MQKMVELSSFERVWAKLLYPNEQCGIRFRILFFTLMIHLPYGALNQGPGIRDSRIISVAGIRTNPANYCGRTRTYVRVAKYVAGRTTSSRAGPSRLDST